MNYLFTLDSVFETVAPKTQNQLDKPVCFTHANVLLSCVNKTMYLLGDLPFVKIHISRFKAWDDSPCASAISKWMLWVMCLMPLSFETFPFSIS